jgi:hypothetical protein
MTRYPMRLDPIWRLPLLIIGATPERSYIELDEATLKVHFGRCHETIPLAEIARASTHGWSMLYGIGVRIAPGGIGYVGSTRGVVQISLKNEIPFRVLFHWRMNFRGLFVALEDPDTFIRDIEEKLRDTLR